MGGIGDKRLRDLLPTVDAYRPVALTVAAILGIVALLPTVDTGGTDIPSFEAAPTGSSDELAAPAPPPTTTSPSTTALAAPAPTSPPAPSFRTSPSPTTAQPNPEASPSPAPAPPPATPGTTAPEPEPVRIRASGWASATGGSPLGATDVPDGSLPVGNRVGQVDKVAFVRLSGDRSALVLAEDAAGRRGGPFDASPVQACQIVDAGWQAGEDQALADAPEWDPEACVAAQRGADGTWTIPLLAFADPTDERGLALVPAPDAPIDFQVAFAGQAVT